MDKECLTSLRYIFFFTLFFVTATAGYTQTNIYAHGVIVAEDSTPVSDVNIIAIDNDSVPQASTISLEDGSFVLRFKESGSYTIRGTFMGTLLFVREIEVNDSLDMGKIITNPYILLESVTISADKLLIKHIENKLVFNVQNFSGVESYKIADVLKYIPGVGVNLDGSVTVGIQSAQIILDDRLLSPDEASSFIHTMNAKNIKQIEVQTMRSGEQDANIEGGVIHIRTLKARIGVSGNADVYLSSPKKDYYSTSPGFNLFYGKENWNLYATYYYNKIRLPQYSVTTNDFTGQGIKHTETDNYIWNQNQHKYKLGSTFNFGKNNFIGVELNGIIETPETNSSNGTILLYKNDDLTDGALSQLKYDHKSTFSNVAISYLRNIDSLGSTFKLLGNYNYKKSQTENIFHTEYNKLSDKDLNEKNLSDVSANTFSLKGDLRKNWINNLAFTAGFQIIKSRRSSDLEIYANNSLSLNSSSYWDLTENLSSAYLGLAKKISSSLYLNASLRTETTRTKGNMSDSDDELNKKYTDWFPYFYISYQPQDKMELSTSYTQSIYRPAFSLMNNYSNRVSDVLYDIGNPHLRAQRSHRVEVSFRQGIHSCKLSYRFIPNLISENFYVKNDITYHTNANKGTAQTIGLDYSLSGKPTHW